MTGGELVRFPQNDGERPDAKLMLELKEALEDEVTRIVRSGDRVPKRRMAAMKPSMIDLLNEVLFAYICRPREWRDRFRLEGREILRRHQRSPVPLPVAAGGSPAAEALELAGPGLGPHQVKGHARKRNTDKGGSQGVDGLPVDKKAPRVRT